MELQDRVRELDLSATLGIKLSTELTLDGGDSERDPRDARISQLEIDLARMRAERSDENKRLNSLHVAESKLEDLTRIKEKLEEDYRRAFEKSIALENELEQLRSIHSQTGVPVTPDVATKLQEYETEIARLKAQLNGGDGSKTGAASSEADQALKKKMDQLVNENRSQAARINSLLMEKESLQVTQIDLKERSQHVERVNSELRASLAAMETKGQTSDETTQNLGTATQRLVQLTDQNVQLQESLKKAKEHIINLDKKIRNLQEADQKEYFADAIETMQRSVKIKEMELERAKKEIIDTRAAAKREQRLIASAWYETGLKNAQRSSAAKTPASNHSWLAKQRQRFDSPVTSRHR
eukprot:jgi/Hompol1/5791/HPOL_004694-RA